LYGNTQQIGKFNNNDNKKITSPPQSHLGRARHDPHVRECTLSLRVLAVACTMRNKLLQNVTEALQIVTERYRSNTELLRNVMEPLWKISILPIT